MTKSALLVATEAWDHWMAGDVEGFLNTMAEDGLMTMPGHAVTSGQFRGRAAIGEWAKSVFEDGETRPRPHGHRWLEQLLVTAT